MKHRFYTPKYAPSLRLCRVCGASSGTGDECLIARHADPEIDALYRARRKAAVAADGSGYSAIKGWGTLEQIESKLREIDPDGDWRREGNRHDGRGWRVTP
jgi:hypothetical protein